MVYNYSWPQERSVATSPVSTDGLVSPQTAARMRMIALTPRRNYKKVASNLAAHGYSPICKARFETQALERELMPQFPGFFSRKEKAPEGVSSRQASPGMGRTPRAKLLAASNDQFQRPRTSHMPLQRRTSRFDCTRSSLPAHGAGVCGGASGSSRCTCDRSSSFTSPPGLSWSKSAPGPVSWASAAKKTKRLIDLEGYPVVFAQ